MKQSQTLLCSLLLFAFILSLKADDYSHWANLGRHSRYHGRSINLPPGMSPDTFGDDNPDWANIARYNESDAQLIPLPPGTNQVIFMGDSITDNWSSVTPFFPGKPFVNRGIGGQITPQMLVRFRSDVINLRPDVVLILAGINDIGMREQVETLDCVAGNIYSMAETSRANGIQVIIASVLPVCGDFMKGFHPPKDILIVNEKLKAYAAATNTIYLDYFSAMVDENGDLIQKLSSDCLHPNADGYAIMTPLALAAIDEALSRKARVQSKNEESFLSISFS